MYPSRSYSARFSLNRLKWPNGRNFKGNYCTDRLLTHFESYPCIIRVINTLCLGIHPGAYCLNIQALTIEIYHDKKYVVGEECFCDVTVSYPVYG